MIIKREEKNDKIKCLIESSNIIASNFDTKTKDLILTFKNGTRYKYGNVKGTDYNRFELAESQGKVFNSHIKQYAFERIGAVDVDTINNSIDDVREETKIAMEKHIIDEMKTFIDASEVSGRFPSQYLKFFDSLDIDIEKYKSI